MTTLDALRIRWRLDADGAAFATATSLLQPVRDDAGRPCMLKLARLEEERRGGRASAAWPGDGAVPVLRHDAEAVLMPRATGGDLVAWSMRGRDDDALDVIAELALRLHAGRPEPRELIPLPRWFAALHAAATTRGGLWAIAWTDARTLLATSTATVPLHGDLHHGNILDFGPLGWRAIDPKGLHGDPAFEFASALLNPERSELGGDPARLRRRAQRLAVGSGYDLARILAWTEAFCALSAAWAIDDGVSPAADLAWRRTVRAARDGDRQASKRA